MLVILFSSISCQAQNARNGERENENEKAGIISTIQGMNHSRAAHTATVLDNGKVLIAGGANRAEIFDPAKNTFEIAEGKFETARLFSTATLLQNGQVLIAGGYDNQNAVNSGAWIYKSES